jgi:integrase
MITDAAIKSGIKAAKATPGKRVELKDDGNRGEGRLALQVRVKGEVVTAEWYAVFHRYGKRAMTKIGSYPSLRLADARREFRADYLPAISRGEAPARKRAKAAPGRTVLDLFTAYCDQLDARGSDSSSPRHYLLGSKRPSTGRWKGKGAESAAQGIGGHRLASEISAAGILPYLQRIHARGAVSGAGIARAYLSAAFNFAIKSANSYHRPAGAVAWGIAVNPVAAIPSDPAARQAGSRHLVPREMRELWQWLETRCGNSAAAPILQLCIATGQRPGELLRLTPNRATVTAYRRSAGGGAGALGLWDPVEQTIFWEKTKNGQPHLLPVASHATAILGTLQANRFGLFFGRRKAPQQAMTIGAVESLVKQYLKENPSVPYFTPRDLRRTWKTVAGAAGLSKDIRDRLQNHSESDVSSRHYDRFDYLAPKRAAARVWDAHLGRILAGAVDAPVEQISFDQVA